MGDGLVKPVQQAYGGRINRIDSAVDAAVKSGTPAPTPNDTPAPSQPTTAAEAVERMKAIKARQEAPAKGLVKPTVGDRLKKLVGLD